MNNRERSEQDVGKAGAQRVAGLTRIFILTQYSLPDFKRNMNAYQRIVFGSQYASVVLLIRRKASVSAEIKEKVTLHRAPVHNRWLFFIYAVLFAGWMRLRGSSIIITTVDGFAGVGFLAKFLGRYFWVMDVWDRPRWRTGYHEAHHRAPLGDRFVFWLMGFADLYLLSCLPRAAKDIRMPEAKRLQLYNAISLDGAAHEPPPRNRCDPTLHVAYGRSKFHWTVGQDAVVKAAEILHARGCPVIIHFVGQVSEADRRAIESSPAAALIQIHGFIPESRTDFFRCMHVGLAVYKPYEDMSYIFPIKVLEHLREGNPVIASRLPGLCAMVQHEYNGLPVEPGDPRSLADAIARLQCDWDLWHRLSLNAIESVKRFDVVEKNRRIFEAVHSKGGSLRIESPGASRTHVLLAIPARPPGAPHESPAKG
jgi:glycosyltransferase involved in cell wall biosynthesis